jgi:hypothetical protein
MHDDGNDKVVTFDPKEKRKLKQLRPSKPQRPMTLKEALMASLEEDNNNQTEYFDEVYAKLLRIKARMLDCKHEPASEEHEARFDKLLDRESDALWEVIHARAIHRWQIARKLELVEEALKIGQNWVDQREFFLLASARMDLEHIEPRRPGAETLEQESKPCA